MKRPPTLTLRFLLGRDLCQIFLDWNSQSFRFRPAHAKPGSTSARDSSAPYDFLSPTYLFRYLSVDT